MKCLLPTIVAVLFAPCTPSFGQVKPVTGSTSRPMKTFSAACQERIPSEAKPVFLADSKPSAQQYEELGKWYGRAGYFQCAIEAFQFGLAQSPDQPEIRYDLALAFIQERRPNQAVEQLREVLKSAPESFRAQDALGLALQDLGDVSGAEAEFQNSLRINPAFPRVYYDLAGSLSARKNYQSAAYYLKAGLAQSPGAELAEQMNRKLAAAYALQNKYSESVPILEQLVAAHPNVSDLRFDLATAYAHCEKYDEAANQYKEVFRLDPHRADAELL